MDNEDFDWVNLISPFESGWMRLDLSTVPGRDEETFRELRFKIGDEEFQVRGLPVIGLMSTRYTNGVLPGGVLSNYAGSFSHHGSRHISRVEEDEIAQSP